MNQTNKSLSPTRLLLLLALAALPILLLACRGVEANGFARLQESEEVGSVFFPVAVGSGADTVPTPTPETPGPTPTPETTPLPPPLPPPTRVAAAPPIDFAAARAAAQAQGLDLAFNKIGFHVGPGGNANGLGTWMNELNDAGVPFVLKSVDSAGAIREGQDIILANEAVGRDVPHVLIFRRTDPFFETPFWDLPPAEAAAISWERNRPAFDGEQFRKDLVWMETINEPGRFGPDNTLNIEWLGEFSLETAKLAVEGGYKYAAFGWSTGVPEPFDWESPAMLDFLRFAGEHPDQVAVSLHEYSLVNELISRDYPYLVGRFQFLFDVCDRYGIPRPTVLVTEWGWEYNSVPEPGPAMEDIDWNAWLYAAYPEVLGATIWYLGPQFGGIANQAQRLIAPVTDYSLSHYFIYDPGIGQIDAELFRPNPPTVRESDSRLWPTPYPRPRQ